MKLPIEPKQLSSIMDKVCLLDESFAIRKKIHMKQYNTTTKQQKKHTLTNKYCNAVIENAIHLYNRKKINDQERAAAISSPLKLIITIDNNGVNAATT
jgi:hypothetical protein